MEAKVKKPSRPGRGKAKGNSFENTVAKKLTSALSPLKFIRTQGSGARVGGKNYETIGQLFGEAALKLFVGDVVPVNEQEAKVLFKYSIECKSYAKSDSFETIVAGNSNLFKWMQESIDDAVKIDRLPMLVFKWNRTPIYVAVLSKDTHPSPFKKLTLEQKMMRVDIFYLDDLLADKDFWMTHHE